MGTAVVTYSIDTSALIHCWRRGYPPDSFPSFWVDLDTMIDQGTLVASREVLEELKKKDDELTEWASERPSLFVDTEPAIQLFVREILQEFPYIVKNLGDRTEADPFVIAVAKIYDCAVVTQERHGSDSKPKIPDVCDYYSIRRIDVLTLIREQKWIF